jgi:hypothetical protein
MAWSPGYCVACGHPSEFPNGEECQKHREQREHHAGRVVDCPLCKDRPGQWPTVGENHEIAWVICPGCRGSKRVVFEYDGLTYHPYAA